MPIHIVARAWMVQPRLRSRKPKAEILMTSKAVLCLFLHHQGLDTTNTSGPGHPFMPGPLSVPLEASTL